MQKRNFVIRTIRNGQVKIFHKIFVPSKKWLEYDGRLDGQRWAFALYWRGDKMLPFVELWGSEEEYRAAGNGQEWDAYCKTNVQPPSEAVYNEELENWYFPWANWHTEEELCL